jgi:RNA polymerase sigma-70 factor (ECF subfamily)
MSTIAPEVVSAAVVDAGRILDTETLGDHVDRLYRAAWALCGSRADAEDLVQDTFARVLAKPRRMRNDNDLGYLLQVLRNTFFSSRRTASRRIATVAVPEGYEPVDPSRERRPEDVAETREVFAMIAGLKDNYRDALVAVDVVGLSYAEAAKLLKTKEATIASRVFRARVQVADGMEPSPSGVIGEED